MTEISAAIQIAASPEQVWAVLADLASYPEWNHLFSEASGQLSAGKRITPAAEGGTRLVQTETYSGLLAHFSAKTTSRFEASFQALKRRHQAASRERDIRRGDTLRPARSAGEGAVGAE